MNQDDLVMIAIGGTLTAGSLAVFVAQLRGRGRIADAEDEFERRHMVRRSRRRLQTTALLALLGLFLVLHPFAIPAPKDAPKLFITWWLSALVIAGWLIILALADILSTSAHNKVALDRIHLRQRQLHQQIEDLQRRQSNGHDS